MTDRIDRRELLTLAGVAALGPWLSAAAGGHRGPAAGVGAMRRLIANENPYGPGPAAQAAAKRAATLGWRYATSEARQLKAAIADHEGVDTSQVMIGAGSAEILRVAALRYARDGGEVLTARPTFSFLPSYARRLGAELNELPLTDDMAFDLTAIAAAINERTRLVYLCNPNNPTGTRVDGAVVRAFCEQVSNRVPVLIDEAYMDLADDFAEHTALERVLAGDPVIIARTFSKLHGMAGLRVGYALAPADIIKELEQLRVTIPSLVGVMAATASLGDKDFLAFSRAQIREAMRITTAALDDSARRYTPSFGNFVLFDAGVPARDFSQAMRSAGILTGMGYRPYDSWARISMGKTEDMQALAAAMAEYFQARA
jgi:histidinol-phosphate aminotransferase